MKPSRIANLEALPGGIGVSHLVVYDTPASDGLIGGSPHMHFACSEAYLVIKGQGSVQTLSSEGFREVPLSAGCRLVASGSYDGSVLLWDMHAGKQTWRFDANMGHVLTVAFSSDGRRVVAGGGRLLPVGAQEDPFEF